MGVANKDVGKYGLRPISIPISQRKAADHIICIGNIELYGSSTKSSIA